MLDGFLDDVTRARLLDFLTEPGWAAPEPPRSKWERATCDVPPAAAGAGASGAGDDAGGDASEAGGDADADGGSGKIGRQRRTWGLKDEALRRLAETDPWPKLEVQSRLAKLYPDAVFAHMPSAEIQGGKFAAGSAADGGEGDVVADEERGARTGAAAGGDAGAGGGRRKRRRLEAGAAGGGDGGGGGGSSDGGSEGGSGNGSEGGGDDSEGEEGGGGGGRGAPAVDCAQWVANAAVAGDSFSWHVDADPCSLPDSPWVDRVGR